MTVSRVGASSSRAQENVPSLANSHVSEVARRALRRQREEAGELPPRCRRRLDLAPINKKRKTPDVEEFPLDRIIKKRPGCVSSAEQVDVRVDLTATPSLPDPRSIALRELLQEYENPFHFRDTKLCPPFLPSLPEGTFDHSWAPNRSFDMSGVPNDYYTYLTAYSENGDSIATVLSSQNASSLYVKNLTTNRVTALFSSPRPDHDASAPVSLLFTPKGKGLIFSTKGGTIEVWSLEKGQKEWEIQPAREAKIDLSAVTPEERKMYLIALATVADRKILTGDSMGNLYQIDQATRRVERIVPFGNSMRKILKIALSPNGVYIAVVGGNGEVAVLNSRTFETIHRVSVTMTSIRAVAFAPDGSNWIAVGGGREDPSIYIFPFLSVDSSLQKRIQIQVKTQVTNIVWSEKNRLIYTCWGGIGVIPLALNEELFTPYGKTTFLFLPNGTPSGERVLFADLRRTKDGKKELLCTGKEILFFYPLPTKKNIEPEASSSFETIIR